MSLTVKNYLIINFYKLEFALGAGNLSTALFVTERLSVAVYYQLLIIIILFPCVSIL